MASDLTVVFTDSSRRDGEGLLSTGDLEQAGLLHRGVGVREELHHSLTYFAIYQTLFHILGDLNKQPGCLHQYIMNYMN